MNIFWAIALIVVGVGMVIFFAEQLVKAAVGTSIYFRLSVFVISVIFIGFDPENLGVGAIGSLEGVSGIAMGSIIGAAMVAIALALGITSLITPLKFRQISRRVLFVPLVAMLLFILLIIDRDLNRVDGIILLAAYFIAVIYLIYLNKKGFKIEAGGEIKETLGKERLPEKGKAVMLMIFSLFAIVGGSEMLVKGSEIILDKLGLSDTLYGMTILALLISIEEIARELPAALKGQPDITLGNVVGSVLAFFLFNAGIIALIHPVKIEQEVIGFFMPICYISLLFILISLLFFGKISRGAGLILICLYLVFILYRYFF